MNRHTARSRLCGCYVTIPTLFRDDTLAVDLDAIRQHVRFLIDGGIITGTGVLLAGGAAGDFSTMTFDERVQVAEAAVQEARGRVPVVMGAQTTSTLELVRLAQAAQRVGAEFIQVSPPFYFAHTEADFYDYVMAAAEAADVGLIIYNTFWTSYSVSTELVETLQQVPNVIGLKWSMPDKGRSWQKPVEAARVPGLVFSEPSVVQTQSGKLLLMSRDEVTGYIYQSESLDGGFTWFSPNQLPFWGYPAHAIRLMDGRILIIYGRRKEPFSIRAAVSEDEGQSWGREIIIRNDLADSSQGLNLGYPSVIEYEPGKLFTAYYAEDTDGMTCIWGMYFIL